MAFNDKEGLEIAKDQVRWILGKNPFHQSMMYGVGYHYSDHYTTAPGQMVGSLSVGTYGREGQPYWPTNVGWTFKETWIGAPALYVSVLKEFEE